jgi:hypothetical protein
MEGFLGVLVIVIMVFVYFLPAIVGSDKKNASAIFVLNLFLGWTLIGWVIALVWAVSYEKVGKPEANLEGANKKCPFCAEFIKEEAKICRFCGKDLPR